MGPGDECMVNADFRPDNWHCFYCGETVLNGKPFVFWHSGTHGYVVLHPVCACSLGFHLTKDAVLAGVKAGEEMKPSGWSTWETRQRV